MTLPMSATGAESTKIGQRAATDAAKKAAGNVSVPAVDAQRYDPSVFTSDKGSEAYIREQDMQARVRDEIQSRIQNGEALSQEDMASILQQRRDELTQAEQQAGVSSFMPEEELDDYRMRYGSQDKSTFTKQSAEVSNDASPSTSPADHITDTSMPKSDKSPEVPLSPRNKDADQALTQQYGKSEPPHLENGEEEPGLQQQINDMRQEIARQKAAWENGEADAEEPDQEQAVPDVSASASAAAPAMSNAPDGTKTLRADTEEPTAIPKMPSMPESKKPVDVLKDHLTGKSSKQHIVPEKPKIPQPHTGDPSVPGVPNVPGMVKEAKDLAQAAKGGAPGVAAHVGKKLLDQAKSKIKNPNGSTSPLYSSKSPLGQKALSANPQKKKPSATDAVKEKAAEALVNKGLDVASKAGPAPVKIGAKIAKEALKNEAVKGALKDALDKTPLKGALGKDDKDSEENGMGRGSLRSKKTTQSSALIRMHKAMMVAKFALPLILLLLVMVLMGSCVAGIFGMITGSDDGGSSMIEQSQGSFIPTVKVGATKGICDEDEEDNEERTLLNKPVNDPEPDMYIDSATGLDKRRAGMDNIYENVFEVFGKSASSSDNLPEVKGATCAAVVDSSGYLYGKNAHAKVKIASVTKTMTALVASEFPADTKVTVHQKSNGNTIPGSGAATETGDTATLEDMLKPLMLISANDTAFSIAYSCGGLLLKEEGRESEAKNFDKCVARFVERMNEKARELGMSNTKFNNPAGLDDTGFEGDHVSTAYDVILMTKAAYAAPMVKKIVSAPKMTWTKKKSDGTTVSQTIENFNSLITDPETSQVCKGMKPGNTVTAGICVSEVFDGGGENDPIFVVVLGQQPWDGDAVPMYEDAKTLWRWAKGKASGKGLALDYVNTKWKSQGGPGAEREDCIELSSSKNKKQPSDNTSWVYLKQADFKYSVKGLNVPSSGCWMTSFCMVWSTYSGEAHEPKDLSTQMQGAFVGGGLGSRQGMADALNKANIGLDCKVSQPPNFSEIDAALAGGGCAMFFMNNKPHMAVIIGKNDDGTYKIADPAPESGKDSYNMSGGVVHKYKGKDYGIEFAIICNKK